MSTSEEEDELDVNEVLDFSAIPGRFQSAKYEIAFWKKKAYDLKIW